MLRSSALATALLLALGVLSAAPAQSAPVTPTRAAAASTVTWGACSDPDFTAAGLQCAKLQVPLDYAHPTGAKVTLALTRLAHKGADYKGIMLTNPGGPGGSGLTLPVLSKYVPSGAGASYDWIGFDPRGVGESTPSLHCSRSYFQPNRPRYEPTKRWIMKYWRHKNRAYANACGSTAAKRRLLAHLTTLDTVRDMNSIRAALGETKLNYYGFSYGTYLGQVYATRYPSQVGRFVLDGVVNPRRVWYAANLDQDRAFDSNMDVYWRYLARHPKAFHLGTKWRTIKRGYYRELRKLDRHASASGRLGPSELADVMLNAGYYVYDWVGLGKDYSALIRQHHGKAIYDRWADGNLGDDNGFAMYNAVQCSDVSWPGWNKTRRDSWRTYRKAPFLTWGNTWYNAPCLNWHAPTHARLRVSGSGLSPKILLISETRDAATPYSGALAVRRLFPSARLIAGVGGTTHASSLSGVDCVDNTVASYLANGTLPSRRSGNRADRNCPRLAPPQPESSSARLAPSNRMSPLVREALLNAQRTY